jgi:hypothetical protein
VITPVTSRTAVDPSMLQKNVSDDTKVHCWTSVGADCCMSTLTPFGDVLNKFAEFQSLLKSSEQHSTVGEKISSTRHEPASAEAVFKIRT